MELQQNARVNTARGGVKYTFLVDLRCEGEKKGKSVDSSQGGKKGCKEGEEKRKEKKRKGKERKEKKERRTCLRWWGRGSYTYHVVEVVRAFEGS